jgi:hypothetical protein
MSHFDPIDPNVLIPFMPTVFYTVQLFWGPTCVGLHSPHPHTRQVQTLGQIFEFRQKDFLGQIIHNYVHKTTSHLSLDFNLYTMLMNLS